MSMIKNKKMKSKDTLKEMFMDMGKAYEWAYDKMKELDKEPLPDLKTLQDGKDKINKALKTKPNNK